MKTVIDAVNELKGGDCTRKLTSPGWYINQIGALSFNGQQVCTKDEFNDCVHEMSKAEWIKPKAEAKPIYTQAMADNGELPSVGMEVRYTPIENDSNTTLEAGQYVYGKVVAYHDGLVWTSDNGLRKLSNTRFKPITPPIKLTNGDAYQFDFGEEVDIKGLYNDDEDDFYCVGVNYARETCTNIKHLTV